MTKFKPRMAKLIGSAAVAVALTVAASNASAEDWAAVAQSNCAWCHGDFGQGYATAPRLAGQKPQYLAMQLKDYHRHSRDNPLSTQYMWPAAFDLNARTAAGLASYYASIQPKAAKDGNEALSAKGKSIYVYGIPEVNIGSCAVCHGPNAQGAGQVPRLGGLGYVYLKERLEHWGQGYHMSAVTPMPQIGSRLPAATIEALASYLSFVD
jgi:cytochrome c553